MQKSLPDEQFPDETPSRERHLQQLQRMAMLGTLAAGLGHDLRNLIMPVLLRLDVLAESKELPESAREDIAGIRTSIARLQRLAGGLRLLAANPFDQRDEHQLTHLPQWWHDLHPLVVDALAPNTRIEVLLPPHLPPVAVPPGTLAQVMINLVMNARRAMDDHEAPQLKVTAAASGTEVVLHLRDNGCGMDPETRRRCFEPFFTTRPREYATGLGLSTGRALMSHYRGDLTLSEADDTGATFSLHLPIHQSALGTARTWHKPSVRIALRDPRQQAVVRLLLSQRGMREWAEGDAAVRPDVVICDAASVAEMLPDGERRAGETEVRLIAIGEPNDTMTGRDIEWIASSRFYSLSDVLT
ncbi:MAG: HAMP domain-containing sensor histidine kinase [Gemmatimonadaceae bacterium]